MFDASEDPGPPALAYGAGVAQLVAGDREIATCVAALRRYGRWAAVGLASPPTQWLFARDSEVLWPKTRHTRVEATLLFDGAHLVGLSVSYLWGDPGGREMIASVVRLDERAAHDTAFKDAAIASAHCAFTQLRAQRIRVRSNDVLATHLCGKHAAVVVDADWYDFSKTAVSQPVRSTPRRWITRADFQHLGVFGPGLWPIPLRPHKSPNTPIVVRDPSSAHKDLLQSSGMWRGAFFADSGTSKDAQVVVIGAGLSGLCAAYALRDHDPLILEFNDRIGGTAASERGFALGAHYQCDLGQGWDPALLRLYKEREWIHPQPRDELYRFVDEQFYVDDHRHEQALLPDHTLRRDGWRLFEEDATAARFRELMTDEIAYCPTRLTPTDKRDTLNQSFRSWLTQRGFPASGELARSLETSLTSDYGAGASGVSAFAGIHFFVNRPYFDGSVGTFAPPQGLSYFADSLAGCLDPQSIHLRHMVRRVIDRGDHVEVIALDLAERCTRRFRAKAVVYGSPKKAVPYVFPADRRLFDRNRYAAWVTVTFEMNRMPESELLCWSNHVAEKSGTHIGFTWANHRQSEDPPILTHYMVLPPGRLGHARVMLARPGRLAQFCRRQMEHYLGRDVGRDIQRVTIQKLGHAMPTPVPGSLLRDPNARRSSARIIYAGVDTGRLPILSEALDSGLQAAEGIKELL